MVDKTPWIAIHQCHEKVTIQGVNDMIMQIRSLDPPRISLKLFVKGVGLHSNANLLNIYTAQNKLHLSGLFSSLIIIAVGPI